MIKDISSENIRYDFGLLSISVDDLIKICEQSGHLNVTAKNESIEFESLDDIKFNKALLAGSPTVYFDKSTVSFGSFNNSVKPSYKANGDTSQALSLYKEILQRKGILDKFCELRIFKLKYIFAVNVFLISFKYIFQNAKLNGNIYSTVMYVGLAYSSLVVIKFLFEAYVYFFRQPVYYKPTQSFFRRHIEAIVLSAITGVIALGIGIAGPKLIEKLGSLF